MPLFLIIWLTTTWMRPANRMKMMGVSIWQRLVFHALHCNVRSFRNCIRIEAYVD